MTSVAVVAHVDKQLGGGLSELRDVLSRSEVMTPMWFEVAKSKKAGKSVRHAMKEGADLIFVWGGDGMVQRSMDALAGTRVPIAIIPAGTANLLSHNLGIPRNIEQAVEIGLHGRRRLLDLGVINGEHFGVMAGTGFDALMMRDADRGMKDRVGRLAYVWTGLQHLGDAPVRARIRVDGSQWFSGQATCVLVGNVGTITGGLTVFEDARPDDGVLDIGVVTAHGRIQWSKVVGRMAAGRVDGSPAVQRTTGKKVDVRLDRPLPYELDGGDRDETDRFKIRIDPQAIAVCVPEGNLD